MRRRGAAGSIGSIRATTRGGCLTGPVSAVYGAQDAPAGLARGSGAPAAAAQRVRRLRRGSAGFALARKQARAGVRAQPACPTQRPG
jgi:hypothetical protein